MWTAVKTLLRLFLVAAAALWICVAGAQGTGQPPSTPAGRFTFAWPLEEGSLKPRGATTRGAAVELDASAGARFVLKAPVDQGALFMPFFEYAGRLADGGSFDVDQARAFIRDTLRNSYLAPVAQPARPSGAGY